MFPYGVGAIPYVKIEFLVGIIPTAISLEQGEDPNGESAYFKFHTPKGYYVLEHESECCENVWLADICGDIEDLIGVPILLAESVSGEFEADPNDCGVSTWTFYKFTTIKGSVTLRWLGSASEDYSTTVDLTFVPWRNHND